MQQRSKEFKNIIKYIYTLLDFMQSINQKYKIIYLGNRFRHWNKWSVAVAIIQSQIATVLLLLGMNDNKWTKSSTQEVTKAAQICDKE